jgi:hypothetical protein
VQIDDFIFVIYCVIYYFSLHLRPDLIGKIVNKPKLITMFVKKTFLISIFILLYMGVFTSVNALETDNQNTNGESLEGKFLSSLELEKENTQMDNFFRRLFGVKERTVSQRKSRSRRHNSKRPQRYSPPESNSQSPDSYGGGFSGTKSSDLSAVRNTPKPPLTRSRRDQYKSLGSWEMGFSLSTTHTITDIASSKGLPIGDFANFHSSHYSMGGGIYGRYLMNDWFALNLGMNFANLKANRDLPFDLGNTSVTRFNNDIFEFFTKSEFYLPGLTRTPLDLYGFVGIGVFFSDATIYDSNDRLISSQVDYNQVQPFIPFGGGLSIKVTNTIKVGYEFGWRNTIFHYLDGIKNDNSYDHYFLNSLKIGVLF